MWENVVELGRPHMAIWRMRVACWVPEATDTHSEYVTVGECGRAGQATHGNMVRERCMICNLGFKHKIRICISYCFSNSIVVARTRLNATLHVHCLCWPLCWRKQGAFEVEMVNFSFNTAFNCYCLILEAGLIIYCDIGREWWMVTYTSMFEYWWFFQQKLVL